MNVRYIQKFDHKITMNVKEWKQYVNMHTQDGEISTSIIELIISQAKLEGKIEVLEEAYESMYNFGMPENVKRGYERSTYFLDILSDMIDKYKKNL